MLISLQILAKTFPSNIIIDLSYNLSKYIQSEVFENCLKWVVYINTLFSPCYRLGRNGKLLKFLRILITVVYFKDRNWISKTVYCISCLVVCKIVFCSEFPDIPDNAGRKTRRRRRTQAIATGYAFHGNTKIYQILNCTNFMRMEENFYHLGKLNIPSKESSTKPNKIFYILSWLFLKRLFLKNFYFPCFSILLLSLRSILSTLLSY